MRLLAVAPFPPRRDATHGGGRIAAELLLRLAERHEVGLLYLKGTDDEPLHPDEASAFALHQAVELPAHGRSLWSQRARRVRALLRGRPLRFVEWSSSELAALVEHVARTWKPDACLLLHEVMAQH